MNRVLRTLVVCSLLVGVGLLGVASAADTAAKPEATAARPHIQMAILLDTSGSMRGLIDQAKTQLWKIVNELATAKRDGQVPDLQVALYEYGKSSIPASESYLRMIQPLTTDLDKVSEELFALKTNGGSEYCGTVIKAATEGLAWSEANNDLKVVYIAGNEPFTQGKVHYADACKAAIAKGIIVNTIHCGPYDTGVNGKWADGAKLADGTYMNIDQNRTIHHVSAPQDKKIAELNVALNKTYVTYGRVGKEGAARQMAQDRNAAKAGGGATGGVAVQRAVAKSSAHYRNAAWDLGDAVREGKVDLDKIKTEDLPENMQKMKPAERKAYVDKQLAERTRIQTEVRTLNEARKKYVAAEMAKLAKAKGADTLDSAMIKSLREQAAKKGFKTK